MAPLFLFEPDLHLIRAALEHRDLSAIIASGRLYWFTAPDKAGAGKMEEEMMVRSKDGGIPVPVYDKDAASAVPAH